MISPITKSTKKPSEFSKITISLSSPQTILDQSHGEVVQPETINYRTYKPEMGGLLCEKIFGPQKNWECHCGKYRRIRYKNIVCDRCGVEVTEKKVRRERMGHIQLTVPIVHIWYFRSTPSKIGYLLGLQAKKLEQIIYYERYIVIQAGVKAEEVEPKAFLTEEEYLEILETLPKGNQQLEDTHPDKFIAKMGAEAVEMLLSRLDLNQLVDDLKSAVVHETSQQRREDAIKRLRVVQAMREAKERLGNLPEWMVIRIIPVIPPDLRPLIPLDGGRFATSDLNDLYRRVIIRNNRLKRLKNVKAPEVILRNEMRMLQESVDCLFDNTRKVNAIRTEGNRPLKSLSDILKGKSGRFRQNLLGKRVDYSGRSVIVVGPELEMSQCGLPKNMASELFKPFIIRKLLERGIVKTVKSGKKMVEAKHPCIWDILENILQGHPVLLNRAPTLHRLGIQAFQPKLIEGSAIQLHPLVCTAFNADFDGDQMAVHVPLSNEAILEASLLMLASHNILNPANGAPIAVPSQDMILGLYYLSKEDPKNVKNLLPTFYGVEEVIIALNEDKLSKHTRIRLQTRIRNWETGELTDKIIETIAGRVLFNNCVPEELGYIDALLTKKELQKIIGKVFQVVGVQKTAKFLDDIKSLGFHYAYEGGLSFGLDDIIIPSEKKTLIEKSKEEVEEIIESYQMGEMTPTERYNKVIETWTRTNVNLTDILMKRMKEDKDGFNSIYMMMDSGARGSREQIRQLGGIRGLMAKPRKSVTGSVGEIIENPILSNFKEGLDVLEYFISTHGARKGLADTALKTADAGYLTRRLVDVGQGAIISQVDCGTLMSLKIEALKKNNEVVESLGERILGRVTAETVINPLTQKIIVDKGEEITETIVEKIENSPITSVQIRSVLSCESRKGICSRCYGRNLATGRLAQEGDVVGVIAAQSIGEPGTQLTLRTFHVGGTAGNVAVDASVEVNFNGIVEFEDLKYIDALDSEGNTMKVVISRGTEVRVMDKDKNIMLSTDNVPYGSTLKVTEGDFVKKGDIICQWDPFNSVILSHFSGTVEFEFIERGITYKEETDDQTGFIEKVVIEPKDKNKNPAIIIVGEDGQRAINNIPVEARLAVSEGDKVQAGSVLVKIPRTMGKGGDITGGLPRVTELFEARNPSNPAVVSEIEGQAKYGGIKRSSREITIESKEGVKKQYLIPLSKHILVQDGDKVRAGSMLCDGSITPKDILAIEGPTALQAYLVNEIQDVYRNQGVRINDKHIEVIIRQMMKKVKIVSSGNTFFLPNQLVDKLEFRAVNDKILGKKLVIDTGDSSKFKTGNLITVRQLNEENSYLKRQDLKVMEVKEAEPAVSEPHLQGITKASLNTSSFISAASFQETARVLSMASVAGQVDNLEGLKENVIVGALIPGGTGLSKYRDYKVSTKEDVNQSDVEKTDSQEVRI